jgi:hypothetical protein
VCCPAQQFLLNLGSALTMGKQPGCDSAADLPLTPLARCVMALGAAAAQQTGSLNTLTSTTVMGCKHPITRLLTVSVCTPVVPQSVHPMWGRPPLPGLNATITFGT